MLVVFGIMYFLVLQPQAREKKEHEKLISSLSRGDRVVTASGIHGTIVGVADDTIQLEIGEKVRMVIDKGTVARRITDEQSPKAG